MHSAFEEVEPPANDERKVKGERSRCNSGGQTIYGEFQEANAFRYPRLERSWVARVASGAVVGIRRRPICNRYGRRVISQT